MHRLRAISPGACHCQQGHLGRNWPQQLRQHCGARDIVRSKADSSYLQCLRINTDVQLAPLTPTFCAMLFALPFALPQERGPCGVKQQVQLARAGSICHLQIQAALSEAQRAEVGNCPRQPRQGQQRMHKTCSAESSAPGRKLCSLAKVTPFLNFYTLVICHKSLEIRESSIIDI